MQKNYLTYTIKPKSQKSKKILDQIRNQYTEKQLDEQAFVKGGVPDVSNLDEDYLPNGRRPLFNENTDGIYRLNPDYFDRQQLTQTQVIVVNLGFDIEAPQRWQVVHPFLKRLRENIFTNFDFSKLAEMLGK